MPPTPTMPAMLVANFLRRDASPALITRCDGQIRALDAEKRTAELSLSSETPVQRYGDQEILSHDEAHVRLGRLREIGAIHLDHDTTKPVAAIREVKLIGKRLVALVQFGRTAIAEDAWKNVQDGIVRGVSVGYRIHKVQLDEDQRIVRAIDWEPYEASLTTIPADPTVGIGRSADDQQTLWRSLTTSTPAPTTRHQEPTMNKLRAILALIATFPLLSKEIAARAEKLEGDTITEAQHTELRTWCEAQPKEGDEKKRAAELAALKAQRDIVIQARSFDVDLTQEEVEAVRTTEDAKDLLLRAVAAKRETRPAGTVQVQVTADETDKRNAAAVDGLLACTLGRSALGADKDLGLRRKTPLEIIKAMVPELRDADNDQLARFASRQTGGLRLRDANQSAANFTNVLGNFADKVVMVGYNSAPRTHELWTSERLVDDFKDVYGAALKTGLLEEQTAKGAPAKEIAFAEAAYNASLGLFMRTLKVTYQDWRNDDLGTFADALRQVGNMAANTEEWQVYKALLAATWTNHITTTAAFWDDTNDRLKFKGFASVQAALESKTATVGAETVQINPVLTKVLVTPNRYNAAMAAIGQGSAGQGPIPVPVQNGVQVIKSPWLANSSLSGYSTDDFYLVAGGGEPFKVLRDRLFPQPRVMQLDAGSTPDMHFLIMHAFRAKLASQDFLQKGDWS
jgi:HK97 family phage prohead protease